MPSAHALIDKIRPFLNPRKIRPGDHVAVVLNGADRTGQALEFVVDDALVRVKATEQGWLAERHDIPFVREEQVVRGTVKGSLYESGTDVAKQREMGLTGALVVRPPGQPNHANGRADSLFDSNREYVYLLSEVDPDLHLAVERKRAFDVTKTRARYFFINGRSMPDTIAPSNAAWLPNQPYGSLVHLKPVVPGDTIEYHMTKIASRKAMWWFRGEARVGGQLVAEAEVGAMIADA